MEQLQLLRLVIEKLDSLGLPHFVTGSLAATYYGEARMTNDIDVVVKLPRDRILDFCRAFPDPEFYLDEESVREAVESSSLFNIIHPESALKIDVMIPARNAFNFSRFSRARRVKPESDWEANFASPEDVILKKMEFYREGRSEKHLRDIASMFRISGDTIDKSYISDWAERLGLLDTWRLIESRLS